MSQLTDPLQPSRAGGAPQPQTTIEGRRACKCGDGRSADKNKINVTHGLWDTWGVCTSLGSSIGALFSPSTFFDDAPSAPPCTGHIGAPSVQVWGW